MITSPNINFSCQMNFILFYFIFLLIQINNRNSIQIIKQETKNKLAADRMKNNEPINIYFVLCMQTNDIYR